MKEIFFGIFLFITFLATTTNAQNKTFPFMIGVGVSDTTGPASEVGMMGYAMVDQFTSGIHFRQRARAYLIGSKKTNETTIYVSLDACFCSQSIKQSVIAQLKTIYGSKYTEKNVMISGTHTHSGPAGFTWYPLYDITALGFQKHNLEVITKGIVKAIQQAHANQQSGRILLNHGTLITPQTNINRSPTAYLANPSAERAQYDYNVDKLMTVLRLESSAGVELGAIVIFPVHGTSMNNTNKLISGDNKGYASYLFEREKNGDTVATGSGAFVAAFGQANEGDVSPNVLGAFCGGVNGTRCEIAHSTCGGMNEGCIAYGPGKDDFESTKIIGTQQYKKAKELYDSATIELTGEGFGFRHTYVDMQNVTVAPQWTGLNTPVTTCKGALGDSFAAGTTDGPGEFNFEQGTNDSSTNEFWNFIGQVVAVPSEHDKQCQSPKPILLFTGGTTFPTQWTAGILPLQIFRWDRKFVLVAVPAEFSTMSGRRLKKAVLQVLQKAGQADGDTIVEIAGLANSYSHYVTTPEEFSVQRYEGASTLYGPNTLPAYLQEYARLAEDLANDKPTPDGPPLPDNSDATFNFLPGVIVDAPPLGKKFGDVLTAPKSQYAIGEVISVDFVGANLRNNYRTDSSFLSVERFVDGEWKVLFTDSDINTKLKWRKDCEFLPDDLCDVSRVTVEFDSATLPVQSGRYRVKCFGDHKSLDGTITAFEGVSPEFSLQ